MWDVIIIGGLFLASLLFVCFNAIIYRPPPTFYVEKNILCLFVSENWFHAMGVLSGLGFSICTGDVRWLFFAFLIALTAVRFGRGLLIDFDFNLVLCYSVAFGERACGCVCGLLLAFFSSSG